jgi:hypothetical protein
MPTMKLRFRRIENLTVPHHIPHYLFDWENGVFERDERLGRTEQFFDALDEQPWLRDAALGGEVLS